MVFYPMDNRLVFFRDNRGRQSEAEAIWWFPFRHDGVPPSHHPFHGMFPDINQRAGGSPFPETPIYTWMCLIGKIILKWVIFPMFAMFDYPSVAGIGLYTLVSCNIFALELVFWGHEFCVFFPQEFTKIFPRNSEGLG